MRLVFLILLTSITLHSFEQCEKFAMEFTGNNPTCHDFSDGSIQVAFIEGNGPFSFVITNAAGTQLNFANTSCQNNLSYGWYYCHVTNSLGCVQHDSVYLVNPPEIQAAVTFTNPSSLVACDGIAQVDTVIGYQGNYNLISYYWGTAGGGIGQTVNDELCNDYYELTVNDAWGCSSVAEFEIGFPDLGIVEESLNVQVYPNPASSHINIYTGQIATEISIYDGAGRLVKTILPGQQAQVQIPVDELLDGIYFVQVCFQNAVVVDRILIKN